MFTLQELRAKVDECRAGRVNLDGFEDWFRDHSKGAYADKRLSRASAAVEAALSKFYFQNTDELQLREELASPVLP